MLPTKLLSPNSLVGLFKPLNRVSPPPSALLTSTTLNPHAIMTTRLQVHLSAKGLKNMAGFRGTSDPFAVVTVRGDDVNNRPRVVGQTDV